MGAPRSKQFDDVYFSAENGFAETEYVFLKGNNLPENWLGLAEFTIGETGFGTGLNFLAAWRLFRQTNPGGKLHFISFEKFPLTREEIECAMAMWRDRFPEELGMLLAQYPEQHSGAHRIVMDDNCTLTLVFGDVNETISSIDETVDCWFLDGFKPRTNPDMWTETVFQNMARMSRPGTTLATFTAAGLVRRGLATAGFEVRRIKGYGSKWHMVTGVKL
jgi:tRNA 5-methylaminomethyl-2-thiouridine biosynthesis bifunctional protein